MFWIRNIQLFFSFVSIAGSQLVNIEIIDLKNVYKNARSQALGLVKKVLSFDSVVSLSFMKNIMYKIKILTEKLEAIGLNIIDALMLGETQNEYEKWLDETTPANDTNLMDKLEEAINFIVLLASKPEADSSDFDEMQVISVVQFLRTIKTPNGVHEPNNIRLMEYIDKKGEEFHKQ